MPESPLHHLADILLRRVGGVSEFVLSRRAGGMSWRAIATEIHVVTRGNLDVTGQTLANWYPDANGEENAA